ncbi:OsmC family protein [Microbulbifer sp. CAU 1566]|uniref:OsmC family protein n=1 Tax=Microbulbifer sp. CAU 1566 TaxID=2933269 RepID=UPI002006BD20|nr:OsmC family protein [Microbulbifer sp. CAU 1566]MCK7596681.1 OsmC family protein [Microbulbifer sp. CAU 1566]
MQALPHHYHVTARATADGNVNLTAEGVAPLLSAPPVQFGGPGDQWSPEDLLTAAVADCFILTFRAIAKFNQLEWTSLECSATGTLDKDGRKTCFTAFEVNAKLEVPAGSDKEKAHQLLEKSEESCLVTNSLSAAVTLNAEVTTK